MKIEKKVLEDLFVLFDQTLNVNAKESIAKNHHNKIVFKRRYS